MRKLKQKEIPEFRKKLAKAQENCCWLCHRELGNDAALDHDHKSGHIRAVLHKDCNALLGKVENYILGYGKRHFEDRELLESALASIYHYIFNEDYSHFPLHPKHKTETDKQISTLRRRLKSAKKQETKDRLKQQIKELQENKNNDECI